MLSALRQIKMMLQKMLLDIVPTEDILKCNLSHLLGMRNRFVRDMEDQPMGLMPTWFMRWLFDTGNTSFYWFRRFVLQCIHLLRLNRVVCVGHQEKYKDNCSMNIFAMRVSRDVVVIFVYSSPNIQKNGMLCYNVLPDNIMAKVQSDKWGPSDWDYCAQLKLDCMFQIQSA